MNINIILPYKETYSEKLAGAVSLLVSEVKNRCKFKKNIKVFGSLILKKPLTKDYISCDLSDKPFYYIFGKTSYYLENIKKNVFVVGNTIVEPFRLFDDKIRKEAKKNKLVVGSQARILYADAEGRMRIAKAFNEAIARKEIGPVILGRDHHDVSGTDSPYRETSNIYDGSRFTSDMAIQNVIGDSFRGATWVSIHNGGGVGWGEVINGGFGLLLDGSARADQNVTSMLHWDVNNGIARRNWARNPNAIYAIERAMKMEPKLKVTLPNLVDSDVLKGLF